MINNILLIDVELKKNVKFPIRYFDLLEYLCSRFLKDY